jgi:hypothetical protein
VLEHYQDAYVLHRRFQGEEGFGKNPGCVNLALPAARRLHDGTLGKLGFVDATRDFYRYGNKLGHIEKYKYAFFANQNTVVNIEGYYSDVIPDETMMATVPKLVQGGTFKDGKLETPGLFDHYLDQAASLTVSMWREVAGFLSEQKAGDFGPGPDLHRLSAAELAAFPLLGRHWNLDCGIAPRAGGGSGGREVPETPDTRLQMGGQLMFDSVHQEKLGDIV